MSREIKLFNAGDFAHWGSSVSKTKDNSKDMDYSIFENSKVEDFGDRGEFKTSMINTKVLDDKYEKLQKLLATKNAGNITDKLEANTGKSEGVDPAEDTNATSGGVDINRHAREAAEAEKQRKIGELSENEAAVFNEFEKYLEDEEVNVNNSKELQEKTLEFVKDLSDEELADFITAYNYVNEDKGGIGELLFTLVTGTNYDWVTNMPGNCLASPNWEIKGQVSRIIGMLSEGSKRSIMSQLFLSQRKSNVLPSMLETIFSKLFGFEEDNTIIESNLPEYISIRNVVGSIELL